MSIQRYTTSFTELLDQATVAQMPPASNGQILIGTGGTGMVLSSITPGSGISVGAGAGAVTITCTVVPADATGAIQFNTSGSFAGNASKLYWDDSTHRLGILTNTPHASIDNQGSQRVKRQLVTTASYTIDSTNPDFYVGVNYTAGLCTITLPSANTGDGGSRTIWIGDESGSISGGGGIKILPAGSDTVNGQGSGGTAYVMDIAYGLVALRTDGAGHWVACAYGPFIGTGTVFSVGLTMPTSEFSVGSSPVTSSGTIAVTYKNQSANTFFAGPSTGSATPPTFRTLVAADVPGLPASKITSGQLATAQGGTGLDTSTAASNALLVGTGTGLALSVLTAGTGIGITNSAGVLTITATGGSSSTESANTVFAGPTTGSAATPTFRALVAADIPSLPASQITSGQLSTARGGTGLDGSAATANALLVGNGSGFSLATLTAGTNVTITNSAGLLTISASGTGGSGTAAAGGTGAIQYNGGSSTLAGDETHLFWDGVNKFLGLSTTTPSATFDNQGSECHHRQVVNVTDYTVSDSDYYLGVDASSFAVSITLPSAALVGSGTRELIICDEKGAAGTHTITLLAAGTDKINNTLTSYTITTNFGKAILQSDGSSNWTVSLSSPSSPSSSGTVTSVGLSLPSIFSVSGSPVTTSGTLTGSLAGQTAYQVFASPGDGTTGAPSFRPLVSLDIPSLPASKITSGQLAPAQGGTGLDGSAMGNGQLLIGNSTGFTNATLQAGQGIQITNGAGSITIGKTPRVTVTYSSTVTFDLSQGDIQAVTLAGNPTFAVTNATVGRPFTIYITQDGTGNRGVGNWFSGITWNNGIVPQLTPTAGKTDRFDFVTTSAGNYFGVATPAYSLPAWTQLSLPSGSTSTITGFGHQIVTVTGAGSAATTLNLPTTTSFGSGMLIIKDRTGNAATHAITVAVASGDFIDSSFTTSATINTNYGVLRLWCDSNLRGWYII